MNTGQQPAVDFQAQLKEQNDFLPKITHQNILLRTIQSLRVAEIPRVGDQLAIKWNLVLCKNGNHSEVSLKRTQR